MIPRLLIGLPGLLAAAPALATGGFDCWTTDRNMVLTGSFGNSEGTPIDAIFLQIGERALSTAGDSPELRILRRRFEVTQSREILVILARPPSDRAEIELRGRLERDGTGSGTLYQDGVGQPVRCEMERMEP